MIFPMRDGILILVLSKLTGWLESDICQVQTSIQKLRETLLLSKRYCNTR